MLLTCGCPPVQFVGDRICSAGCHFDRSNISGCSANDVGLSKGDLDDVADQGGDVYISGISDPMNRRSSSSPSAIELVFSVDSKDEIVGVSGTCRRFPSDDADRILDA